MINHAVRIAPSTLGAVLADARNAYGEPGVGSLPLDWMIDERVASVRLGAEQAIATLRILQEAVANAVRHAQPTKITLCTGPGLDGEAAELRIEDDGAGDFVLPSTGGLANMQQQALAAGLSIRFDTVCLIVQISVSFKHEDHPQPERSAPRRCQGACSATAYEPDTIDRGRPAAAPSRDDSPSSASPGSPAGVQGSGRSGQGCQCAEQQGPP
jgi:hypothetical protein